MAPIHNLIDAGGNGLRFSMNTAASQEEIGVNLLSIAMVRSVVIGTLFVRPLLVIKGSESKLEYGVADFSGNTCE